MADLIELEVGDACARLLMSDGRIHEVIDSYPNGRLILSALYNRMDCKYPSNREAQRDLLTALGHPYVFRGPPVAT